MGAWGYKTFEDDASLDLVDEWINAERPHDVLENALVQAQSNPSLDYEQGHAVAVAAALLEFALSPGSTPEYEELAQDQEGIEVWLASLSHERLRALLPLARAGLDKLLAPDSELAELWQQAQGPQSQWVQQVRARQERLRALLSD